MRRFHKRNPLHGTTEDLLLAGAAVAVVGLVGYAMYSKSKAAQASVTPANQNVTQWNQTTQEAYDAWEIQQGMSTTPPATAPISGSSGG